MADYKGRMKFGNKTRNERYRQLLNVVTGDPLWADVQLLIGEGGADAAAIVDESSASRTVTSSGTGTAFDDAQFVFGSVSALVATQTFSFFEVAHDATNMDITDTWTCEMRVRWDAHNNNVQIVNKGDTVASSGFQLLVVPAGGIQMSAWDGAQGVTVNLTGTALLDNTWYDIALEKNGTQWTTFVDGVVYLQATETAPPGVLANSIQFGHSRLSTYNAQTAPNIWYDELRWTQGQARYGGAGYTIATEAFPRS